MSIRDTKMILDRVLVEIQDLSSISKGGIIMENRDRIDAIKYAKVLSVGEGPAVKDQVKVGDTILVDQYDSVVAPDPDNKRLRILEWHEILGVIEDDK